MKKKAVKEEEKNLKKKEIKDYLYLNMDFLETFIAQIDGGYNALQISDDSRGGMGVQGSRTNTVETGIDGKSNGILGHLVKLNGYAKVSTQSAPTYNIDTQLSKNVIYMKQRENILDRFIEYLNFGEAVDKVVEDNLGKCIVLEAYFDYVNISRLEILSSMDMYDFYREQNDENGFPLDNMYKIKAKLPLLRKLFPFDTFLYANGIIVLINDDYLRDNKEQAGYKFNSKVKVIGTVNKLATESRKYSVPASVTMDKIQIATLSLLRELGFIHENDKEIYFVTPIAIYV